MRTTFPSPMSWRSFVCGAFLLVGALPLSAQVNSEFQITRIEPSIDITPQLSYSIGPQKNAHSKNWMEVEVAFSWHPTSLASKVADDVVITYRVLLANRGTSFPRGTLLEGEVTLVSIPARKKSPSRSVMYLSHRSLERFFEGKIPSSATSAITDIGITITYQGKLVAQRSLHAQGEWWESYQPLTGFLLPKSETPFAPLFWDYYEDVKKQ